MHRTMRLACLLLLSASTLLALTAPLPAQTAPFIVTVQPLLLTTLPALQSFAIAQSAGNWVLVGGRTNGFHRTSTKEATFPSKMANEFIYVVDVAANKTYSLKVPAPYLYQLRSTNMEYFQDGDILYLIGGYGSNCDPDQPSCYVTFGNIIALRVGDAIAAIKSASADALSHAFISLTTTTDPRFQVTGGGLSKLGDYFYLTMGQNFSGIYKGGATGVYTDMVKRFKLSLSQTGLSVTDYQEFLDPTPPPTGSRLHRRDLNVTEQILPTGQPGIVAYGGVFTADGSAYQNPVSIYESANGGSPVHFNPTFAQKMSLYECGHISFYDQTAQTSYTVLLGGISLYYFDAGGNLVLGQGINFMPFINSIDVIATNIAGQTTEFPQPPSLGRLPTMLGADAVVIPAPGTLPAAKAPGMIAISSWPSTPTLVGYLYGGIQTADAQVSFVNPSKASNQVYGVYVQSTQSARARHPNKPR